MLQREINPPSATHTIRCYIVVDILHVMFRLFISNFSVCKREYILGLMKIYLQGTEGYFY